MTNQERLEAIRERWTPEGFEVHCYERRAEPIEEESDHAFAVYARFKEGSLGEITVGEFIEEKEAVRRQLRRANESRLRLQY